MAKHNGRWLRLYTKILNSPKVIRLSDFEHRVWIGTLCASEEHGGIVPPLADLALLLRAPENKVGKAIDVLIAQRLIDATPDGQLRMHDWDEFQYRADISTDRVKQHRATKRVVKEMERAVSETRIGEAAWNG